MLDKVSIDPQNDDDDDDNVDVDVDVSAQLDGGHRQHTDDCIKRLTALKGYRILWL